MLRGPLEEGIHVRKLDYCARLAHARAASRCLIAAFASSISCVVGLRPVSFSNSTASSSAVAFPRIKNRRGFWGFRGCFRLLFIGDPLPIQLRASS